MDVDNGDDTTDQQQNQDISSSSSDDKLSINSTNQHIHKKVHNFTEGDKIWIDINEYEIFEHREIVWAQIEGYEWHPSQILFKWKNGERLSPISAKQQFGAPQVLVAFFDVHQTAKIKLSQRRCIPFYHEPNLDIYTKIKNGKNKHLIESISKAMILATLQKEINNKLRSKYHHNIHTQNSFALDRCDDKERENKYTAALEG